jgi:hypothetical protein
MKNLGDKKGVVADYLPWLLIGIAILTMLMITVFLLKDQGFVLIDKIKNLVRMR